MHHLAPYMLATGDDAGCVKIWDIRMPQAVAEHKVHEDYVADMAFDPERHTLISVSGDATLAAYDLRQQKVEGRSDEQEDELHSVCIIKHGRKLVCGSQDGVLLVFHWGRWGDCTDRFPGHPDSVDAMVKIDESTIATGSSDGLIRVVQIQPNKHIGIIGDMQNFPVEGIKYSRDKLIIGTYAHDEIIRFWDTSFLLEDEDEKEEEEELEDEKDEEEEAEGTGEQFSSQCNSEPRKITCALTQTRVRVCPGEEKGEQPMMERGDEEGGEEVWEDVSDEDDSDEDDDEDDDSSVDSLDKEYEKRVKNRLRRGREKFYDGL